MQNLQLSIDGFRSFKGHVEIAFPQGGGLYVLNGRNEVEPALGANGAGKSTLWDALTWCFFGKTARGIRAGRVCSWGTKKARVATTFDKDGDEYILIRQQNPNLLEIVKNGLSEGPIQQDELEALMGFDYECWTSTALMSQFGSYFFDLSPSDKMKVLSSALQLDVWIEASKTASRLTKDAEAARLKIDAELTATQRSYEETRTWLRQFKEQYAEYDEKRAAMRKEYKRAVRSIKGHLQEAVQGKKDLGKKVSTLKSRVAELEETLGALQDYRDKAYRELVDKQAACKSAQKDVLRLRKEAEMVRWVEESKCPTCQQLVSKKHADRLVGKLEDSAQFCEGEAEDLLSKATAVEKGLKDIEKAQQQVNDKLEVVEKKLRQRIDQFNAAQRDVSDAERELKQQEQQLAALDEQDNPHAADVKRCRKQFKAVKAELADVKKRLRKAERKAAGLKPWSGLFKEVRLWLVEQALTELEVSVNNNLIELGLHGWEVKFDVERETATGGVARGFTVSIIAPTLAGGTPVLWEEWSGGETQRLRIAGAAGVADLLRARQGINLDLEVWDEPTAHLSKEGIEDVLAFLRKRADETGRQIWLVDHRLFDGGGFDGQWTCVKREDGTVVEQD